MPSCPEAKSVTPAEQSSGHRAGSPRQVGRWGIYLCFFLLSPWICGFFTSLEAQERSQFAVLDYAVLNKEYYKAKESKQRLDKKGEDFQKEFKEREDAMKQVIEIAQKLQEDLQSPVISEAKKKEITGQLREKKMDLDGRQKAFFEYRDQCMGIMQKLQFHEQETVLADISRATALVAKNKYVIVYAKPQGPPLPGGVTFHEGIDEITPQVLAILNKDAPAGGSKKEEKK